MSLRKSALSGMLWTFIQQMGTQGISFVVSIILARILLPEEFGLIAMLAVVMGVGYVLVDGGMAKSLIRTKDANNQDYSAVFLFNFLVSIIMYGLVYITAPLIADFYNQPLLVSIARVYCLVFVINAFALIQNAKLAKELDFKKQTLIMLPSVLIGGAVGIYMAYNGYGVWSLVWGAIAKSSALSLQLWFWSPWMPTFKIQTSYIKKHLGFGYKLTLAGVIDTIFRDIYTIIIGKYFDPFEVGFYNRANSLRMFPVKNLSTVLNKVTYPLFSKIQDDDERLKKVYRKIMLMALYAVAPTLFFMAALAEPLFRFLLTEKWMPAVPYFQILCFSGVLFPIHAYNLNLLTVKGETGLFLRLEIIKKTLIAVVVAISFQWGIFGLLFGSVFVSVVSLVINTYYTSKFIKYGLLEQLKDLFPTIFLAALIGLIVYVLDNYVFSAFSDLVRLILGAGIGISSFGFITFMFKFDSFIELKELLKRKRF